MAETMELRKTLLELDTAFDNIEKLNRNIAARTIIENFAADTTKPGCWSARAVLNHVDGRPMNFMFPGFNLGARKSLGDKTTAKTTKKQPSAPKNLMSDDHVGFKMYPNPARDLLQMIVLGEDAKTYSVSVKDVLGRTLYTGACSANVLLSLQTGEWMNGIYFVYLLEGNKVAHSSKLLISH